VTVSKGNNGNGFYPIDIIGQDLEATRLTYSQANKQPAGFWKDKHVLFHIVWKGDYILKWEGLYLAVAKHAKVFWIEFDADHHINNLHSMDNRRGGKKKPLFLWRGLLRATNRFVWETPLSFNPFIKDVIRLPLKIYQRKRERPLRNRKSRDIDFLGFVDHGNKNLAPTLHLLQVLKVEGYSVRCIILNKSTIGVYKSALKYPLVKNEKFTPGGETTFHGLLDRTKVFVDLSNRLTTGRVIYEALFGGAVAVGPRTYGSTDLLFPDLSVDTFMLDMPDIYEKCIKAVSTWSVQELKKYRAQAVKNAWAGTFKKDLMEASK